MDAQPVRGDRQERRLHLTNGPRPAPKDARCAVCGDGPDGLVRGTAFHPSYGMRPIFIHVGCESTD